MARKSKSATVSVSVSLHDLDLDALIGEAEASMEEKARSKYGFYLPLSDSDALAEKFLTILEQKDIPFSALELTGRKAIAPMEIKAEEFEGGRVITRMETPAEFKARLDSWVSGLWADIRRGAAYTGRKVSCKEMRDKVGDVLHLYVPVKRKTGEENGDEE